MPATLIRQKADKPRFRGLFPDWNGARPLEYFFCEQLLEARMQSAFPTSAAGFDEDVNVYLAGLLTRAAIGHHPGEAMFGSLPLLLPPAGGLSQRTRADRYRLQGDHRLLYLGLFDRGEGVRRRTVLHAYTREQTRQKDLECGATCYRAAAALLQGRPGAEGLAVVLDKLAARFPDYVHVLGVLATRRLGLGAKLNDGQLAGLLGEPGPQAAVPPPPAAMDELLDLLLEHRRTGSTATWDALLAQARALGVDPDSLTGMRKEAEG